MRWTRHIAHVGEKSAYRVLVRKPEVERLVVRPRHGWEDNIKIGLQEVG